MTDILEDLHKFPRTRSDADAHLIYRSREEIEHLRNLLGERYDRIVEYMGQILDRPLTRQEKIPLRAVIYGDYYE